MQMIADLHTHTLCATHAYNTFTEMAAAAKEIGYCALAVTDHAPAMPDSPHAWHFQNWSAMPREIGGVVMLYGAEANVMDTKGGLDLSESQLKAQDWVVASIHSSCVPGLLTRREANRLWLAVAENPYVDIIGHSEQENYRYDYDLVTKAFARNHKVVELNGNSFNVRRDGIPNMRALLRVLASQMDGDRENLQGGQRLLDWPTSQMPDVIHAGYQALMVMAMEAGAEIGGWLGDRQMQSECRGALRRLRRHVPDHLRNKQAAAMLVLAGLADPGKVCRTVIARGGAEGFSTFYGYYMLEALAEGGLYDEALQIISDYWGAMLDLGATTFWEDLNYAHAAGAARIDEPVPAGKFDIHAESGAYCYKGLRHSLCHGWASGPTPWLSRHVLGIVPLEPGCKSVAVRPHLGHLKWAEGTFPTPWGVIRVRHERGADGKVSTSVSAPDGVRVVR